jgi:hypothetical protein
VGIFIIGKSKCGLCNGVLGNPDDFVSFNRAFVGNEVDPMRFVNDEAFHISCLKKHEHGDAILRRWEEWLGHWELSPCAACGVTPPNHADSFSLGSLTINPNSPLSEFNYTRLHVRCVPKWPHIKRLLGVLAQLELKGEYRSLLASYLTRMCSPEDGERHS